MTYDPNQQPLHEPQPPYGPPAPPAQPPKKKLPLILGIIGGLLALCCGGTVIAAVATSSGTPTAATSGHATTAAGTPVFTPSGAAAKVVAWFDGGGDKLITDLSSDFTAIQDAGKNQDVAAMHTACAGLQTHVEDAQAYAHIPDTQAETSWSQALALFARSAGDCLSGTDRVDAALITQAGTELQQGTDALNQTSARMAQIGGK